MLLLGCACLGCGRNRNLLITTQQTPQVLCTHHDLKLSPGICCVASICCVAVCCVAVCCVDTHIKAEASATHIIYVKVHVCVPTQHMPSDNFDNFRRGVCCPLCLWCLLCGYPHNLCHNCHKHVLCHLCLWCLWCLLPAPAALNPIGGRHTSAVGPRLHPRGTGRMRLKMREDGTRRDR